MVATASLSNPYARLLEAAKRGGKARVKELFEAKEVKANNIDLGRLFEECYGTHHFRACRDREQLANDVFTQSLREADGAVTTAAFMNITGQIVYTTTLEAYEAEDFTITKLIPEQDTKFLDGEKIAGITEIGDQAAVRAEEQPYTLAGVGEDWIFTPPPKDRGLIIPVTFEALFADRTGKLLERCADVGKFLGVNREKRAVDCLIDENVTAHRYNWRGTVIASYGDNSGTHTWDNLSATNGLTDWTNLDKAEQVFNGLLDPYTGEPIAISPRHLVVSKQNEQTARRIVSATEIRVVTPGYATSGNPTQTNAPNPYSNKYEVVTSRYVGFRQATKTDWFLADVAKYAKYMVIERMQTAQAPPNNKDEFERRIVAQYRGNEWGAYVVVQPRASVKSTVA